MWKVDGWASAISEMVTEVARDMAWFVDVEGSREWSSTKREVFPFKRSSSAGVKVSSLPR